MSFKPIMPPQCAVLRETSTNCTTTKYNSIQ